MAAISKALQQKIDETKVQLTSALHTFEETDAKVNLKNVNQDLIKDQFNKAAERNEDGKRVQQLSLARGSFWLMVGAETNKLTNSDGERFDLNGLIASYLSVENKNRKSTTELAVIMFGAKPDPKKSTDKEERVYASKVAFMNNCLAICAKFRKHNVKVTDYNEQRNIWTVPVSSLVVKGKERIDSIALSKVGKVPLANVNIPIQRLIKGEWKTGDKRASLTEFQNANRIGPKKREQGDETKKLDVNKVDANMLKLVAMAVQHNMFKDGADLERRKAFVDMLHIIADVYPDDVKFALEEAGKRAAKAVQDQKNKKATVDADNNNVVPITAKKTATKSAVKAKRSK